MKFNDELAEKPDYGHYSICLGRMNTIDAYCRRCFGYTFTVCLLMMILTMFTLRFHVVSWIPNLFGDGTTVAANFVQFLILCGMIVMSGMTVGKHKFFGIILFVIYFVMAVSSLFTDQFSDVFSFFIGTIGAALTFRFYSMHCDYVQLSQTEGFPHFNENFSRQNENSGYVSRYSDFDYSTKKSMSEPEQDIGQTEFTGDGEAPEMDSLSPLGDTQGLAEISAVPCRIYAPQHTKHCGISESPIELSLH